MNTEKHKKKLETELEKVTEELKSIGRINPNNPKDWEPTPEKMDIQSGDDNEKADSFEAYEENTAILKQLEIRFNNLKDALEKIKNGTYSVCEKCGEKIEEDRLNTSSSARTCKKCMTM